jgi:multidrug efflux system outer membrane protein
MRRRLPLIAQTSLIALAALLAGCTLEPPYHQPPLPVPAEVANGYGAVEAAPAIQSWRAFFGDQRLATVIAKALANNRDLPAAVANVQIARSNWIIQRAQLFPAINGQLGATFSQTPASVIGTEANGAYNEHIYSAELGVTNYEVDLFGRVRSLSKSALEQYFASKDARDAAQISLVGQVAQAWLTLGADRSLLAVANDTVAEAKASLDLTKAKFDHGEAAQSDVDQALSLVGQAEYDVGRYSTQVAQDKDALDLLAGTSITDDLLPAGIDDEANILGALPTGVSSGVLRARPDVLEAEEQLKAANANIGAARAAFFPQITLTGSGGVSSVALSSLFTGGAGAWSFVPQLTQPIFDAGKNRAGLKQAKAQRDLAQANYEKAIQSAFRDVADALAQRGRIDQQLGAQQTMTDAAADAVKLTRAEYTRGAASYLDVLVAERTLYAAQLTLATTRLLKASNLVSLYQALGGGLS